jgi:hypothetical protein
LPNAVELFASASATVPTAVELIPIALAVAPTASASVPAALARNPTAVVARPVAFAATPTAVEKPPVAVALEGQTKSPDASWEQGAAIGNGPATAAPDPNMPGAGMAEIAIVAPSAVPARRPIRLRLVRGAIAVETFNSDFMSPSLV